ncbi:hypothetical protein T479_12465 [Lysinibacillus varians]|nr:hypothetical protein T479_12465 [Lysinibacillus varians]
MASNSFTSIDYWAQQSFLSLKEWKEVLEEVLEEGAKKDG